MSDELISFLDTKVGNVYRQGNTDPKCPVVSTPTIGTSSQATTGATISLAGTANSGVSINIYKEDILVAT